MLKIESAVRVLELSSAGAFEFPVTILRSAELTGPVVVELIHETDATKAFSATAVKVDENTGHVVLRVTPAAGHVVSRATQLKARATGTWNGHPVNGVDRRACLCVATKSSSTLIRQAADFRTDWNKRREVPAVPPC
jgi:hypothetical protein